MELFIIICIGIVVLLAGATYFILKWHDRVVSDSRERAIDAGCPYFTSLQNEDE